MPETIRTANERLRSRPRQGRILASCVIVTLSLLIADPAQADGAIPVARAYLVALFGLSQKDTVGLALTLGLLCFAVLTAIILVRTRAEAARAAAAAQDDALAAKADIDRFKALLMSEPQILVSWPAAASQPEIVGDTGLIVPGMQPHRVLAFGTWLDPAAAQEMEKALETLRNDGRGFVLTLMSIAGRAIEAEGRAVGGRAVLRLRDVSGLKREHAELAGRYARLREEAETLRALIDVLPAPVWARDDAGNLTFANQAYARAVEANEPGDAIEHGTELLPRATRDELARAYAGGKIFSSRVHAVVGGQRRHFDVVDAPSSHGSAGIAIDVTEIETLRAHLAHMAEAHRRVLDQLATGVAAFATDRKLAFYNTAFRALWDLEASFLDSAPADSAVLDKLRAERKLPEEQDFRQWRTQLHEAYRAVEAKEHLWHLPDRRAVRVVTTPNPEGGVTYLFDEVTERLDMHRRFEALIKVQSETLDNLTEAVAVFASDGRVRLYNPAFASMWKLTRETLEQHPHVEAVTAWCQALHDESAVWRSLRAAVTAIDDRQSVEGRIERRDGMLIDYASMPLPDGATLVTFQDVTATANVERALRERNEALEAANRIKINFVHHVSYELRSPLTNIIGFAHLLHDPAFGALTAKQREYIDYITVSTNSLLAITNNILDLATIDAGAMPLNLGEVDIRAAMQAAAEGVQDRLVKNNIALNIRAAPAIGNFTADERRLRQILFNLLANAVGFSPPGKTVTLAAERQPGAIVFSVTDHGPGIPADKKHRVFDLFETDSLGSQHRGAGLGLSLVRSFVELHSGTVTIDSAVGQGTTVICTFPVEHAAKQSAA
ncbi:MAG TPA: ATP-binding protein [Pseudolabrys sp.]|nr:ATP-binding protein [Pseudolabrys sp.]